MPLSRDAALQQLHAWVDDPSLLKHARTVECTMRAAALVYGRGEEDVDFWAITGLLHDADYQRWPEDHPRKTVDWLEHQGEAEMAYAVAFHQVAWNLEPKSALDRCLLACDELSGFVVACCLVRPDGIASLTPKSVKKKLKDKAFAAKVDRDIIRKGIELLGVEPDTHIQFVIDALKPYADELELTGTAKG
ncbi:MAG: HD domain-containing protein [Thermoguttaceae bacterium]